MPAGTNDRRCDARRRNGCIGGDPNATDLAVVDEICERQRSTSGSVTEPYSNRNTLLRIAKTSLLPSGRIKGGLQRVVGPAAGV